jgi:MarR family transcriptional regulator, organic hydroperoxide resistance regulator
MPDSDRGSHVDRKGHEERQAQLAALFEAFDEFAQAVRRARGVRLAADPEGLTLSQYGLIEPLLNADGIGVQELAVQAGVTAPTATRVLDTLERRGFVARNRSDQDRRVMQVVLTGAGRIALTERRRWLRMREQALFGQLSARERALAPALLRRLARLVEELAAGPPPIE